MNLDCACGAPAAYVLLPSGLIACAVCLEETRPYLAPDVSILELETYLERAYAIADQALSRVAAVVRLWDAHHRANDMRRAQRTVMDYLDAVAPTTDEDDEL